MDEQPVLTEDEMRQIEEGEAASLLLDEPIFLLAIERVRNDCAKAILESRPDQVEERERLYNLSRGLSAVTEELIAISAAGKTITENALLNPQADEDLVQDDPDQDVDY